MSARLEAPGKLFLAGEYAVLEKGCAALVLAVDRTLELSLRSESINRVELSHRPSGISLRGDLSGDARAPISWSHKIPEQLRFAARATELALRLCSEESRTPRGFHAVFENDLTLPFQLGNTSFSKPGLGGSGAATVLAIRAACAAQERAISRPETLALAAAAHWVEQGGRGSGADIAASSLGGILEARVARISTSPEEFWSTRAREMLADPLVTATAIELPGDLHFLAVWSGKSADTRSLITQVRAFAAKRPQAYKVKIEAIANAGQLLQTALGAASRDPSKLNRTSVLSAVRRASAAMAKLGDEAKTEIMTRSLADICAVVASPSCAGKPSGAGGGDCAIVLAFGEASIERAQSLISARGYGSARVAIGFGKA